MKSASGPVCAGRYLDLGIVIAVSLLLRVVYLILYASDPLWYELTIDNYFHLHWAERMADGDWLGGDTYFRAPFYVYCLAVLKLLTGAVVWPARLFGGAVGLLSTAFVWQIGRKAISPRAGLIGALLFAAQPMVLYFDFELLLDSLFTLLALASLLAWLYARRDQSLRAAGAFGICAGLAAITRPTILPFIALALVILAWEFVRRRHRLPLVQIAAVSAGLILTIAPVFGRNLLVASDPVLIASQGGANLYLGNNPAADGVSASMPEPLGHNWQIADLRRIAQLETGDSLSWSEVSSYWSNEALAWITTHPAQFAQRYLYKLRLFFSTVEFSNNRHLATFVEMHPLLRYNPLTFGALCIAAVLGTVVLAVIRRDALWLALLVFGYAALMALFFVNARFRLPVLPLICLLAGAAVAHMAVLRTLPRRGLALALAATALAAIVAYAPLPPQSKSAGIVQTMLARGTTLSQLGDNVAALPILEKARALNPDFPGVHLNLGVTWLRMGQVDTAVALFNEETRRHPGRPDAYINLASLAHAAGQVEAARRTIRRALSLRPHDLTANRVYCRILFADTSLTAGQLDSACVEAAARTTGSIHLLVDVGLLYSSHGQSGLADDWLRRAVEAPLIPVETDDLAFRPIYLHSRVAWDKQRALALYQRGFLAAAAGDIVKSVEFGEQSLALDSTNPNAFINLVSGYSTLGRTERARMLLTTALARFPGNEPLRALDAALGRP